ncbi:MAG TPA: 4-hydroxythreonine-4-phosphate dehydrogenase PdxA, partial [Candidatus Goldiibacteriota bacterium]|nr:4-hydroxythreonine-4-phosphate dehydrogenase PdxA [Candidatus Goldiibacteriota bacterium]
MRRLKIAVTMGDPAGIGPEITAKLFLIPEVYKKASVTVIGDMTTMIDTQRRVSRRLSIKPVKSFDEKSEKGVINLFDMQLIKYGEVPLGVETKKGGKAQYLYVKKAIEAALKGEVDAIVTAPINKHALHM